MKNKKLIPEIRFPEFSGKWVEKRLGELTKIYDGTHQTPKYVKKGIPFFSVENITQNNFNNTKHISQEAYEKEFNSKKKIEKGDLLLTRIGNIGSVKYFDKSITAGYYVSVALIKNSNSFNSKFLKFYIETPYFQKELYKRTLHIAFPKKINLNEIDKCSIKLPPTLDEQNKIADFLSSVDEKIEIISKKIEELKKYKKGMLQKLLDVKCNNGKCEPELRFKGFSGDWIEKRLGEIATIKNGSSNVEDANNNGTYIFFDRSEIIKKSNKYLFDKEAIIYAGEGSEFYPKYYKGKFDLHQRAYAIFDFANIDGLFLYYLFSLNKYNNYLKKVAVGTTVKSLRLPHFKKMLLNIPPTLAEQEKIASFLSSIDEKIELNENKLEKLKAYKQGLLQKMFV